jgi:transcriptional regulator with GAF, ATPase, and Fis domain
MDPDDLRLETATRRHIEQVLKLTGQRQSQAARLLGIPYSTLQSKMRKLGISVHGR